MTDTVLVVGASGIIGRYCISHLETLPHWRVLGLARSRPVDMENSEFVEADLMDPAGRPVPPEVLAAVTHVVYAGFVQTPGADWGALTDLNTAMFQSLVDQLEAHAPHLKRIVLMQGQKYYGTHLGPFKTPSKEDDPRHAGVNFYFTQQDLMTRRSANAAWDGVCLRPHIVCGLAAKSPMNLVTLMGVYAGLCKQQGRPLSFPGSAKAYGGLVQASDAGVLARSVAWALETPDCGGQAFNITNGDQFRWQNIWPILAEVFEMDLAPPEKVSLTETMPPEWNERVNWSFGDYVFGVEWDVVASTIKARKFGFTDCIDSEDMFRDLLTQLRQRGIVP